MEEEFVANFTLNNESLDAQFDVSEVENFDALFEIYATGTTWGNIDGDINNQTDLQNALNDKASTSSVTDLSNSLRDLENVVSNVSGVAEQNSSDIADINTTIGNYGNVVTYNASDFATAAQGAKADTAIQPNDNITMLNNNAGYITMDDVPEVNDGTLTIKVNNNDLVTFSANNASNVTANISMPSNASDVGALPLNASLADVATPSQLSAADSGINATLVEQITNNASGIQDINALIPNTATDENQLADKNFVNSSIATNTANFIGTFENVSQLEAYSGTVTNNDYAFVVNSVVKDNGNDWASYAALNAYNKSLLTNFDYAWVINGAKFDLYRFDIVNQTWGLRVQNTDKADVTLNNAYNRYKATVASNTVTWEYEYTLNNSSFTADQWAAINSGVTTGDVALIGTALQPNDNISELNNNSGYITSAALSGYATETYVTNGLATKQDTLTEGTGIDITSNVISTDALRNTATGDYSLTIDGTPTSYTRAVNIGYNAQARNYGTRVGYGGYANGTYSTAIGYTATCTTTANNSIQLGSGSVSDANSFCVGFNGVDNYQLLDGTTGLIPDARISSNIARATNIPTKISDLTDDTATYPIDKADTLTGLTASISELNVLNGITATTSELNILDGVTANASEINILDGITATTTELNYTDGVTSNIQTQLDGKMSPTDVAEYADFMMPDTRNMKVLKTFNYTLSQGGVYKAFASMENDITQATDLRMCVIFRMTVTGSSINSVQEFMLSTMGLIGDGAYIVCRNTQDAYTAGATGLRYVRFLSPKEAGSAYKYFLELQSYNNTARAIKLEVLRDDSRITWFNNLEATSYDSDNQNATVITTYNSKGIIVAGTPNMTVATANNAGGLTNNLPKGFGVQPKVAVQTAAGFCYVSGGLVYRTSDKTKPIDCDFGIQFNSASNTNAGSSIAVNSFRQKSNITFTSIVGGYESGIAQGDSLYFRCTMDANGNIYSDDYIAKTPSAGYTWFSMGYAGSTTQVNFDATTGYFFTLDANGKMTHFNGKEIKQVNSVIVDQTYDGTSANAQSGVAIAGAGFITGITSSDVTTALGYTPYNSSNPNGYITSSALNGYLQNTALGANSLTLLGTAGDSTAEKSINIGYNSSVGLYAYEAIAIGSTASATGERSLAIGGSYLSGLSAIASANGAIQIGSGTNSTASSLSVGWGGSNNYQLLDGTTGYIPNARINMDASPTSASTNTITSGAVYTALNGKQDVLVSGTNIKTINGNSILGSGNIDTPYRNIGEIVQSTIPLTDAGLHLLDGSLLAYGSYADFIDYIADLYDSGNYDDIFETEANWQSSVTTYGVCGKFVYDSNDNTVRLPKITGFTEGTITPSALGDLVEAGLPNITGSVNGTCSGANGNLPNTTGCISVTGTSLMLKSGTASTYVNNATVNVNASNSNSIYGNSSTVQPQTIKVLYYIVIATSTKTDIEVDIDEIATDLNGKADVDLTNVPNSKAILEESYINGASWYRVYSDGWCEQGAYVNSASGITTVQFLKAFRDTNYTILKTMSTTSTSNVQYYNVSFADRTTTEAKTSSAGVGFSWVAYGYIR